MDRERHRKKNALLDTQHGLVARWQLYELGCGDGQIDWWRADWRDVHAGVYFANHGPLSEYQRHLAASLSEPQTALGRWSTAALHGLRTESADDPIHVVREGSGGRRRTPRTSDGRLDRLDVRYSLTLEGDLETVNGVLTTTLARAILDLCMPMSRAQRDRLFRDAIRLGKTTREELAAVTRKHRGHRGNGRLRELLSIYSEIPIERTRSDAEIEGLVVLRDAGEPIPLVNVDINGFEGDFVDLKNRRIFELDGPQYHQFLERDRERDEAWQAAGFTVQRRPTDDAYRNRGSILRGMRGEPEPPAA